MDAEELISCALLHIFTTFFLKELGLFILLEASHGIKQLTIMQSWGLRNTESQVFCDIHIVSLENALFW